jgi:hypothetical protein
MKENEVQIVMDFKENFELWHGSNETNKNFYKRYFNFINLVNLKF